MSSPGSVSRWIAALKKGDSTAAEPLWTRYHPRLVALARRRLRSGRRRMADEEDVVQEAFHSFFRGMEQGRFPRLGDRNSLWRLLVVITANKTLKQLAHESRKKRGGGTPGEAMGIYLLDSDDEAALARFVGAEPTPDFAAEVAEEYRRLLELLDDERLRRVAVWKMEGYDNHEIADRLACSQRTVARMLKAIRKRWSEE